MLQPRQFGTGRLLLLMTAAAFLFAPAGLAIRQVARDGATSWTSIGVVVVTGYCLTFVSLFLFWGPTVYFDLKKLRSEMHQRRSSLQAFVDSKRQADDRDEQPTESVASPEPLGDAPRDC